MFQVARTLKAFSKIKPLKIEVISAFSDPKLKLRSLTGEHEWQISNPLESLVGALVACELHTFRDYANREKLNIQNIKFTKIEGAYDIANYMKGGKDNRISEINIEAEI